MICTKCGNFLQPKGTFSVVRSGLEASAGLELDSATLGTVLTLLPCCLSLK